MSKREARRLTAVPRIRFKGCEGEWLRYKISDCFEEREERTAEGELLSVTIGSGVIPARDNGKLDNSSADKSNYKKVCVGDLAYNSMRMWQGACGASAFAGIVSPAYTVMSPNAGHDSLFYQYLFKTDEVLRIFQSRSQGMTSDTWNLKFPLLKEIALNVPLLKEQKYVAAFFSDLEQEIASALARGSKLRQLKQSMLVKMFPQRGKTVPEVRFSEFKGEWEKKLVGELVVERVSIGIVTKEWPLMAFVSRLGIVEKGDRYDRSSLVKDAESKKYKRTCRGDFIYSSNNLETGSIGLNRFGNASISPVYSIFECRCKVDCDFIGAAFVRESFVNEMVKWRQGVVYGQWRIHESDFLKIPTMVPSYKEQQKIGAFFKNLDSLISVAEKKVAKLRQVKASLLERMFV